nr:alpha/beta fold hydrolase [Corynebacterium sp. TAE3-ERU12]
MVLFGSLAGFLWWSSQDKGPQGHNHGPQEKLPVVYVAGSTEPSWLAERFADSLRREGFDVHVFLVLVPGRPETNPYRTVRGNSARLPEFVEDVLSKTGAEKVDVVTYSQGGLVARYWLKEFDGARHVRTMVNLDGIIKGSPFQTWLIKKGWGPEGDAIHEMAKGGPQITALNTPSEALPGIRYVNITTMFEIDAAPWTINWMDGPGDYENLMVQDQLPGEPVFHLFMNQVRSIQTGTAAALRGGPVDFQSCFPWRRWRRAKGRVVPKIDH